MINSLRQSGVKHSTRQAFTLVELLVAMGIFVILATLTVTAFRGTDADRVPNAAATFKSALEGAKSRAIKMDRTVGLRLNLSPTNGRQVTSLIYVAGDDIYDTEARFEYDNRDTLPPGTIRWILIGDPANLWTDLKAKNRIGPGTRVYFKDRSFVLLDNVDGSAHVWRVSADFNDRCDPMIAAGNSYMPEDGRESYRPTTIDPDESANNGGLYGVSTAMASEASPCRLYLTSGILPGAEPIPLPVNTCIDLEGSKVPESWLPLQGNPGSNADPDKYGPRLTNEGNTILAPMDIMFTRNGTIAAPLTTEGILHFRVASTLDLTLWQQNASTSGITTFRFDNRDNDPDNDSKTPIVNIDPERGAKLVSIFTQTGNVMNADVYPLTESNAGFNNDAVINGMTPYQFILYGKESK